MSAIKFIRLEDFLDDQHQGMPIDLEPQGILFAEVRSLFAQRLPLMFPHWSLPGLLGAMNDLLRIPIGCVRVACSDMF